MASCDARLTSIWIGVRKVSAPCNKWQQPETKHESMDRQAIEKSSRLQARLTAERILTPGHLSFETTPTSTRVFISIGCDASRRPESIKNWIRSKFKGWYSRALLWQVCHVKQQKVWVDNYGEKEGFLAAVSNLKCTAAGKTHIFWNPDLGIRRASFVWPPSKSYLGPAPLRAFWPLWPRPEVLPRPEPGPRPRRFTYHTSRSRRWGMQIDGWWVINEKIIAKHRLDGKMTRWFVSA